jgi:hypothetical protein
MGISCAAIKRVKLGVGLPQVGIDVVAMPQIESECAIDLFQPERVKALHDAFR